MPDAPAAVIAEATGAMSYQPITISGATGITAVNGTLTHAGTSNGKPYWTTGGAALASLTGTACAYDGSGWFIKIYSEGTPGNTNYFSTTQDHNSPDMVTSWTAHGSAGGTLAIAIDRPAQPIGEASAVVAPSPVQPIAEATADNHKTIAVSGDGDAGGVSPNGTYHYAGEVNSKPCWTTDGSLTAAVSGHWWKLHFNSTWFLEHYLNGSKVVTDGWAETVAPVQAATPDSVEGWETISTSTGTPVITLDRPLAIV